MLNGLPNRSAPDEAEHPTVCSSGISEIVKYGLIRDAPLFGWLEQNMHRLLARDPEAIAYAVERSCINKVSRHREHSDVDKTIASTRAATRCRAAAAQLATLCCACCLGLLHTRGDALPQCCRPMCVYLRMRECAWRGNR